MATVGSKAEVSRVGAMAGTAYAASATVGCTGPGGGADGLRAAIAHSNHAAGADTIDLAPGCTYVLTNEANPGNGLPIVTGTLVIHGNGATIRRSSESAFRLLEVATGADLTLDQITVSGGSVSSIGGPTAFGGGILNSGRLTVIDSTISDNAVSGTASSAGGGGIANNGTVSLHDTVLRNNAARATGTGMQIGTIAGNAATASGAGAGAHGGGVENNGQTKLTDTEVKGNLATGPVAQGGGLYNGRRLTLIRSRVVANVAAGTSGPGQGGGIFTVAGHMTLKATVVSANQPDDCQPAIAGC